VKWTNDILYDLKKTIMAEWHAPSGCAHLHLKFKDGRRATICPIVIVTGRFDDGEELLRLNTHAIPLHRAIDEIQRLRVRVAELERMLVEGGAA
jgi:hypothetical protein